METIAKFTIGSTTYEIFKNVFGEYRVRINGNVVGLAGYTDKNTAWEKGNGGNLLSFAGIWFQLSENDSRYSELLENGFMPNTVFTK